MEAAAAAGVLHGFAGSSLQPPSPFLTPLQRFLSGSSSCQDQDHPFAFGEHSEGLAFSGMLVAGAMDHIVPNGILLNDSSFFGGGLVGDVRQNKWVEVDQEKQATAAPGTNGGSVSATVSVVKGQWTAEEDSMLVRLVKQHGVRRWSHIAKSLVGRIGKQCRERWHNHLRPDIKKDMWSEEEEMQLVEAHVKFGNRWAEIAKHISGRSENSIKNHWNATKRRLNAKRKSKRKAGGKGGAPPPPSVLQDYIRSKTSSSAAAAAATTTAIQPITQSSTKLSEAAAIAVHHTGEKIIPLDSSLDNFLSFNDDEYFLPFPDDAYGCMQIPAPPEAFGFNYQPAAAEACGAQFYPLMACSSSDNNSCSSGSKRDLDLVEMMSLQFSSSSQGSSISSAGTIVRYS